MENVANFEAYRRRQLRLKALEAVLTSAKTYMDSGQLQDASARFKALADLQKRIEEVDKLPPHHISLVEKD